MSRFLPRSLSTQIALVMTLALLAASAVNFGLILSERARAGFLEASGPAMARFVDFASSLSENPPTELRMIRPQGGGRMAMGPTNLIDARNLPRHARLERRLKAAFAENEAAIMDVRAASLIVGQRERFAAALGLESDRRLAAGADRSRQAPDGRAFATPGGAGPGPDGGPGDRDGGPRGDFRDMRPSGSSGPPPYPMADGPNDRPNNRQWREIAMAAQLKDGRWINAVYFSPQPPRAETLTLALSTFVLFACVLAAALWIAGRLSRPLNDLTAAAARVGSASSPEEVAVRGPSDVRQTLEAFNAMSRRVSQLLNEKDVMLGALGHDLRTPLSSLRIRLETMEPEAERLKAVKTVEETNQLLETILELARQGRSSEPVLVMDVALLIDDVVEDYSETGAPVGLGVTEKAPASLRPVLFRRLLRNLIDNAVTYGGSATVSVTRQGAAVEVRIEDEGPGLSEEALTAAMRPFERGEASRNRRTGGAGLGLTLAESIARTHGGLLRLENRAAGGLAAVVRIPAVAG